MWTTEPESAAYTAHSPVLVPPPGGTWTQASPHVAHPSKRQLLMPTLSLDCDWHSILGAPRYWGTGPVNLLVHFRPHDSLRGGWDWPPGGSHVGEGAVRSHVWSFLPRGQLQGASSG